MHSFQSVFHCLQNCRLKYFPPSHGLVKKKTEENNVINQVSVSSLRVLCWNWLFWSRILTLPSAEFPRLVPSCRSPPWRGTWVKQVRSTRWRWSACRSRWTSWRRICLSFGSTCSATRPTTSSFCASNRTWSWRSPPTGACWRERKRECFNPETKITSSPCLWIII